MEEQALQEARSGRPQDSEHWLCAYFLEISDPAFHLSICRPELVEESSRSLASLVVAAGTAVLVLRSPVLLPVVIHGGYLEPEVA